LHKSKVNNKNSGRLKSQVFNDHAFAAVVPLQAAVASNGFAFEKGHSTLNGVQIFCTGKP